MRKAGGTPSGPADEFVRRLNETSSQKTASAGNSATARSFTEVRRLLPKVRMKFLAVWKRQAFSAALHFVRQRQRLRPISHRLGDDGSDLRDGVTQRVNVEMGIDRRGLALAVFEQSADSESQALHHALGGLGVSAVVDAKAGQPDFLARAITIS